MEKKTVSFSISQDNIEKLANLSKQTKIKKSNIIDLLLTYADNKTITEIISKGILANE